MSPPGCQKMSAKPCSQNAEESCPVLSLQSGEQKPPNPLLIQDKDVLQPTAQPTTALLFQAFRGVTLSRIQIDGKLTYHLTPLNAVQKRILALMEVPLESYYGLVT